MMKPGVAILPPSGGIFRTAEFQRNPPYTSPYALNACTGVGEGGAGRIGVRPGTVQAVYGDYGSRVSTLLELRYNESNTNGYVWDHADSYSIGSIWTVPAWLSTPLRDPLDHVWRQNSNTMTGAGMIYQAISGMDTTGPVVTEITALPTGDDLDTTYRLYYFLDDSSPAEGDGVTIVVRIYTSGTTESWALSVFKGGVQVGSTTTGTVSSGLSVRDSVVIRGYVTWVSASSVTASVFVNYTQIYGSTDLGALAAPTAKRRFGWSMTPTVTQLEPEIDLFAASFSKTSGYKQVTRGVAVVDGAVYTESKFNELTAVGSNARLNTSVAIDGVDRLGKAYFADYNPGASVELECNALVTIEQGSDPAYIRFTTQGAQTFPANISRATHVVHVRSYFDSQGNAITGAGTIAVAIPAGYNYEFANYPTQGTGAFFSMRRATDMTGITLGAGVYARLWIKRNPSYYSPSESDDASVGYLRPVAVAVDTTVSDGYYTPYTNDTTVGEPPIGCPLIAEFKDRLYLAGYPEHQWFASKRGDPFNWVLNADDPAAAIQESVADEGKIGKRLTALMGHTDDILIFGCDSAIHRLVGDPGFGGAVLLVTNSCGVLGSRAWCVTDQSILYFAAPDGIYRMDAGGQTLPIPVSPTKLPNDLRFMDPNYHVVQMVFDPFERCVNIFVSGKTTYERRQWFRMDVATEAFWAMTLPDDHDPLAVHYRYTAYNGNHRRLLMGGRDGVVRSLSRRATTDCRTAIDSRLVIGPLRSSRASDLDAKVDEVTVEMASDSGSATFKCFTAKTPQEVVEAAITGNSRFSKTVAAGLNRGIRPRIRGPVYALSFEDVSGSAWAVNAMLARYSELGVLR